MNDQPTSKKPSQSPFELLKQQEFHCYHLSLHHKVAPITSLTTIPRPRRQASESKHRVAHLFYDILTCDIIVDIPFGLLFARYDEPDTRLEIVLWAGGRPHKILPDLMATFSVHVDTGRPQGSTQVPRLLATPASIDAVLQPLLVPKSGQQLHHHLDPFIPGLAQSFRCWRASLAIKIPPYRHAPARAKERKELGPSSDEYWRHYGDAITKSLDEAMEAMHPRKK